MTPTNDAPTGGLTPEQVKAYMAEMKKKFSVEDLIGYIEDDDEKFPADQVFAEMEEIVRQYKLSANLER